jgi:ribosomal protein S5
MKPTIHLNGIEETLNDQLVVTHVYTDGRVGCVGVGHGYGCDRAQAIRFAVKNARANRRRMV